MSVSLVIPVHNIGSAGVARIRACIRMLASLGMPYEVVIGEDASTDETAGELRRLYTGHAHVRIYYHKKNLGIGKNIYFLYTKARHALTALFSIDGDWNIEDICRLITYCRETDADIVIGKRRDKAGYTWDRHVISFLFNTLTKLFFRVDPIDAGSIKVFKTKLMKTIPIISRSQFFEAELIIKAVRMGNTLRTLPVDYQKQATGRGMWWRLGGAIRAFVEMLRLFLIDLHGARWYE